MQPDTAALWACHWWPLSARVHKQTESGCEDGYHVAFDGPRCQAYLPWLDRTPSLGAIQIRLEERHLYHLEDQCPHAAPTASEKENPQWSCPAPSSA